MKFFPKNLELRNKNYIFAKFNNNTVKLKREKMKKLVFMFVAFVAMTFAACGGQTPAASANDSDSVAIDSVVDSIEVVVDSVVADSTVAE